mgnify:CR=1 FL=1
MDNREAEVGGIARETRIVNVRKRYSEFLGFKIRVRPKAGSTSCNLISVTKSWNWKGKKKNWWNRRNELPDLQREKTFGRNTAVQFNGSGNTELFSTCHLHQH